MRAIRQIHDANELVVVDERKADERARGEVLVVQQRMLLRLGNVAHEQRLAAHRHPTGHALPDRDARVLRRCQARHRAPPR